LSTIGVSGYTVTLDAKSSSEGVSATVLSLTDKCCPGIVQPHISAEEKMAKIYFYLTALGSLFLEKLIKYP
jgi:hypothetical protein